MAERPGRDKAILNCALNGASTDPERVPVPLLIDDVVAAAQRVVDAGAAMVHLHVRDPRPGHRFRHHLRPGVIERAVRAIRATCSDVLVSLAFGSERFDPQVIECIDRARPDFVSVTTADLAQTDPSEGDGSDVLFTDPHQPDPLIGPLMNGPVRLEIDCTSVGGLRAVERSLVGAAYGQSLGSRGVINFILGHGSQTRAEPDLLDFLVEHLPGVVRWQLTGRGRTEVWPLHTRALELGGQLRVGLEDTLFRRDGTRARDNAELIDDLVDVVRDAGREPASPAEARILLGLAA